MDRGYGEAYVDLHELALPPCQDAGSRAHEREQVREKLPDFLYIHFSGDPLAFGFLICTLSGGGLMAGWELS